jgi:alanyl-tRNA synthetase
LSVLGGEAMFKTKRLYYDDSYLREFEAQVIGIEPQPPHFRVYLDQTAFYPEAGGQPMDYGTLGGCAVLQVVEEGDTVVHLVEGELSPGTVKGLIDWPRRFDHMQQHTGQHLLSAAFEKVAEAKTVSFHLGAETSTIDLDSDRLGCRQMEQAEELANQAIFEDRPVHIIYCDAAKAGSLELRRPTARAGQVRVVEVEGFDRSACGGTHVSRTGAIGLLLLRKIEKRKDQTRVEFVCGQRALRWARRDYAVLTKAAGLFSAAAENVPTLIAQRAEELRGARRSREKLLKRLSEYRARELWASAPEQYGLKVVRLTLAAEENLEAKLLAHAVAKQPSVVALIGVKGKPASLLFSQSAGGPHDMSAILRQTVARVGGKGGGTRDFAEGGGLDESKLEDALTIAEDLV